MSGTPSNGLSHPGPGADGEALVGRLQGLLQKQLELMHRGNLTAVVALFEQTDQCVREILAARASDRPGSEGQWQYVGQLYRELSLVLTAQRAEVAATLRTVCQGKRTLNVYKSALSPA
jgi:hypothetical protein